MVGWGVGIGDGRRPAGAARVPARPWWRVDGRGRSGMRGREGELTTCREALLAQAGPGAALVVDGEAGVGKSALLRAVADEARTAGFRVLRCVGRETATTGFA